jgi:hypothetical protein
MKEKLELFHIVLTLSWLFISVMSNYESVPETDEILKISAMSLAQSSQVKFKCSGSLFYFSTNFVFGLEKVDGSMEFPQNSEYYMYFLRCYSVPYS